MKVFKWFNGLVEQVIDGDTIEVRVCEVRDIRIVAGRYRVRYLPAQGDLVQVRIKNIDAPELKQDFGKEAKVYLAKLILGKKVQMRVVCKEVQKSGQVYYDFAESFDRYGRYLADVSLKNNTKVLQGVAGLEWLYSFQGAVRLDEKLVAVGCAWHYEKYSIHLILNDLQASARKAKKGLWQFDTPIAPWVFRKG